MGSHPPGDVLIVSHRVPYKYVVLAIASAGSFITTVDASMVALSIPELQVALDVSTTTALWTQTTYLLTSLSLILVVGRLSDLMGRKGWFVAGVCVMTAGLGISAVSQNIAHLMLSRVVTAAGAAMLLSSGVALLTAAFPGSERGRAMGVMGFMISAGLAVGPLTAGPLLDAFGWRSAFYVRVPLGIAEAGAAWALLRGGRTQSRGLDIDVAGVLTVVAGLLAVVVSLSQATTWGWTSPAFVGLLAFGVSMLALFVVVEARTANPLFDVSMFRHRTFSSAVGSNCIYFIAAGAALFLIPFYLSQGHGESATLSGLLFALYPAAMMVASPVGGVLTDRLGSRWPATLGIVIWVGTLVFFSILGETTALSVVALALIAGGVGSGLTEPANNSAVMGSSSADRLGTASAALGMSRQFGLAIGISVGGALFASRRASHEGELSESAALVAAFQDVMLVMGAVAVAALVVAALRRRG